MKSLLVGLLLSHFYGNHVCDVKDLQRSSEVSYLKAGDITRLESGRIKCDKMPAYHYCVVYVKGADDFISPSACDDIMKTVNEGLR